MRRISGTTWVSIGINAVKVVEATVAAMSRAIWILPKAASRSRFLRSGIQRSPTGAAFTIFCAATQGWCSAWQPRCTRVDCLPGTSRTPSLMSRGVACLAAARSAKSPKSFGNNTRPSKERDLSDFPLLCLFLDGLYEPLRTHGITREAVLCAWGITLDGRKVLISLGLGSKESGEAWLEFVRDLDRRGLPAPLFVTTDGAGGLIQTIDQMWPKSLRGRCWVHRMRNFAAKVPDARWHEIKPYLVMIRDAPDLQAGQSAVREFLEKFSKEFPGLCKCLTEDLEALLAHLQLPWRLRKFARTTNLIERSFVEERRRTKTLPRFFSEKSCLKLVYAVLIRAAARWQNINITSTELLQLQLLYEERQIAPPAEMVAVA